MDNFRNTWGKRSIRFHLCRLKLNSVIHSSVAINEEQKTSIIEDVYRLRSIEPESRRKSTRGGWSSTSSTSTIDQFPLVKNLLSSYKIHGFWFNINPPGSYNDWHCHRGFATSGVVYIKTCPNSGEIIFKNDDETLLSVTPHVGTMLTFPGDLLHRVTQNLSDEDRICLVFNCSQ